MHINYCQHDSVTAQCLQEFSKVPLLVNEFGLFQAIYLGHFSHNFHAQGVTLKGKILAAKCLFQNYLQLLDNFTWLVLKTAKKFLVPSVFSCTKERTLLGILCNFMQYCKQLNTPKKYFFLSLKEDLSLPFLTKLDPKKS